MAHMRAVFSDPGIVPLPHNNLDFSDLHSGHDQLLLQKEVTTSRSCYVFKTFSVSTGVDAGMSLHIIKNRLLFLLHDRMDGQFVRDVKLTDHPEHIIAEFVKGASEEWIIIAPGEYHYVIKCKFSINLK